MTQFKFQLASGDRPLISDVIWTPCSGNGANEPDPGLARTAMDLTGSTVKFLFQGPAVNFASSATVIDPTNGKVQYRFNAGETDVPGDYYGEWQVTDSAGDVVTYPPGGFQFRIVPALPVTPPTSFTSLSDLYDDIRALTGDFATDPSKQTFEDAAIRNSMRVQLRLGRVKTDGHAGGTRWGVGPDGNTLNPPIGPNDIQAYSLLVYHTAHALILPNVEAYQYRTRELSERFGEKKDFLFEMQTAIYELENGEGIWSEVTGLRSWLFTVNGIWVWSYLQTQNSIDLSIR